MSVKLVVMKSGEQVIADIKEMVIDNKAIGYYLNKPCLIEMIQEEGEILIGNRKTSFDLNLSPWIPLAKGETVAIPLDWAVAMQDPVDMLMEMYEENVVNSTTEWGEGLNRKNANV